MAKKKKSSTPRCKRLKRTQRLQSAKQWILMFSGKNLVRNYKNHFGVDEVCALLELKALGKQIDASRIDKAQKAANQRGEAKILNRLAREPKLNQYPDSDQHHYYVAGHTSSGFAYGITWEQAETDGLYCP